MRVQDIMSRRLETISPHEPVVLANELMWRKSIHHLVVLDGNQLVGIVTDTDLGEEIPDELRVADVMSREVVTAEPTMTVDRALHIFRERHLQCLPVIENGRLAGIVTASDIERLAARGPGKVVGQEARGGYPPLNAEMGRSDR
jgi:CBS domain-containing protein